MGITIVSTEAALQKDPAVTIVRKIPLPLPEHPGNIFLESETIQIVVPPEVLNAGSNWRMQNIEGQIVAQGELNNASYIKPVQQKIGWYRVEFFNQKHERIGWTSAAVVARLQAPIPLDSPICLDTAVSWFAQNDAAKQKIHANLAALAGANWVRDRLRWNDVQSSPGQYASPGNYDEAAKILYDQGLQVLQVFHNTPRWIAKNEGGETARFARDLRHVYRFAREMGTRFNQTVQAWEPWNEANVSSFGGHTMDEISSWQKAAWLGFKSSNPALTVGWSAMAAVPTWQQTEGVLLNEVRPYFDTYNIHTYDWCHSFKELWSPALAAAQGKQLWITEADRGAKHDKTAPWYDLTPRLERLKAEYMAQSFASALAAGAKRHFQFILGHYHEPNGVQFGLLRKDFTPRPAYVALAAMGRLLAGASYIGQWQPGQDISAFAFSSKPDGEERDVLVLWTERDVDWEERGKITVPITTRSSPDNRTSFSIPSGLVWPEHIPVIRVYDFMGRSLGNKLPKHLTSAPFFVVLPKGKLKSLPLKLEGTPASPIKKLQASSNVLQVLFPKSSRLEVKDKPWSEGFVYGMKPGQKVNFTLCAYNFGQTSGRINVSVDKIPEGWSLNPSEWSFDLEPMGRVETTVTLEMQHSTTIQDGWVVLRGKNATQSDTVVAFRVKANDTAK